MADIYSVIDKSKKKNRSPCKEESTVGGAFMSPLYDAVKADLESRSVPVDNQGPDAEYSVLARDGVYPRALPAGAAATTAHCTDQIAGKHDKAKSTSEDVSCKRFICILVTITLVTLISLVCLAVLFAEIAKLKSLTSIQDQIATLSREEMENNAAQSNNIQQLNASIDMQLHNQTQQLNMMLQQQHNELLRNMLFQFPYPATSCAALPPSSPSGYYWVTNSNGSPTLVYCTMSCGTLTGGWMRVGFLNMTNSNHQCPSGLMERNDSLNIRTCVRNEASRGCTSVELSTVITQYTRVCGRITAYQVGSVDGFNNNNINSHYVDGVSLTHGAGAGRQHIWSFAAAARSSCSNCGGPSSVGDDYFCGIANPMWCTESDECCTTPYFVKTLPQPTTDDIEMRVCRNEVRDDEDIAIETVEIYVQ